MAQRDSTSRQRAAQKQNTFFGGAAVLAVGILVVKLIGMFYKIPLTNIIGEQGTADFNNAYYIYSVLLTISTAGLPVAVSKLVSEADAQGRRNQVKRTFRLSLLLFLGLGLVSFLVMFFRADTLAGMMNDTKAAAGIRALAPAVVCVGCLSALRGYSQGHNNMAPTSISQIIEALCKLIVGLGLAFWLIKADQTPDVAAAGAITGVTVGTMFALVYMVLNYGFRGARTDLVTRDVPDAPRDILTNLLRIAIPITLSSSMVGIVTVIDSSLVQGQLQRTLLENQESWALYTSFVDFTQLEGAIAAWMAGLPAGTKATMAVLSEQAEQALPAAVALKEAVQDVSRTLYGNYGSALTIYNLPTSLMTAVTAAVIPAVSGALARRDRRGAARVAGSALRISALAAFPMGMGLFVLGTPIIRMLFTRMTPELAGPLLSTLGLATVFVCMMLVCNSVLQAHGFVTMPVIVMVLGGVLKVFTNYNLVARPGVGIFGAPAGNILCFGLCLLLDLVIISRVIPRHPPLIPIFLKPLAASAVMGGAAWVVYSVLARLLSSVPEGAQEAVLSWKGNAVAAVAAIVVAVTVYAVLVVSLRAISRDDLALMPKGDKIARLLRL